SPSRQARRCCQRRPNGKRRKILLYRRNRVNSGATPPSSGIGEPALVRGDGLEAGKSYQLNWTRVVGNRMTGAGWQELSTVVAESKADGAGHAEFRFDVPDDLGGPHGLWI